MRTAALTPPASKEDTLGDQIYSLLTSMTDQALIDADMIPWSSPIPVFGDPTDAVIATVGLNPSNREFVDPSGNELEGTSRRFPTLKSLMLRNWGTANRKHAKTIANACRTYFSINPYDLWFGALNKLIQGTGASFYPSTLKACHLDLVPFATVGKWSSLSIAQRAELRARSSQLLPQLLRASNIRTIILNGATVVREIQNAFRIQLDVQAMPKWTLRRESGDHITGLAYRGAITSIGGVALTSRIAVLGYNHNIQSSFGVTRHVRMDIARWIMKYAVVN